MTRLLTDERHEDLILQQIKEQNYWLQNSNITVDRLYEVQTPKVTYKNIVVNCDLTAHKLIMDRGRIIFGFTECKCYEYINVLQCAKCQRYGHFARECVFAASCKFCATNHETKDCTSTTRSYTCHNCLLANKQGSKFNTRHVSTDDRCPMRLVRIDALKLILLSKN